MPRRKKPPKLNETEMEAFLRDAAHLHETICRPLISPQGGHYRALRDLNEAIIVAVSRVTGEDPDWARRTSAGPCSLPPDP